MIRISGDTEAAVKGVFVSSSIDTAFLRLDGVHHAVPIASIRGIWVRGWATKTGAIVGGLTLAVAGAVVGGSLSGLSDSPESESSAPAIIAGFAGGLAVGALLGGAIGSSIPKWSKRFP